MAAKQRLILLPQQQGSIFAVPDAVNAIYVALQQADLDKSGDHDKASDQAAAVLKLYRKSLQKARLLRSHAIHKAQRLD